MTKVRYGNTVPRVYTPPLRPVEPRTPETELNTLGYSVIDFAESILGFNLYPYQEWLLVHALELKEDGGFRFKTIVVLIARQNGKSTLGQIIALWALYVLQIGLMVGTAQDLATAETLWEETVDLAYSHPALESMVAKVNRTNGQKSIEIQPQKFSDDKAERRKKAEYKVKASTRKAARGLSSDLLLLDEIREHTNWEAWGAISKTTLARPKSLTWLFSNAGDEFSVVLMSLRKKAHAALGDPDGINDLGVPSLTEEVEELESVADLSTLGVFEWSASPGRDKWDRDGWAEANPALGYGLINEEGLAAAASTDPDPVFRTECLCQWVLGAIEGPFPDNSWEDCTDLSGRITDTSPLSYCVDVSVDRSTAWIAVVGGRADGRPQGEIAAGRPGGGWYEWVPEWFQRKADGGEQIRVVVPARSMNHANVLIEPLQRIDGVEVIEWTGPDIVNGCGLIYDRVVAVTKTPFPEPPFAHRGQEALNLAAATAAQRISGDAWYWDRRNSAQDAAPLMAVTGALWDFLRLPEEPPPPSLYDSGPQSLM